MPLQRRQHAARRDLDAIDKRGKARISRCLRFGGNGVHRALEVVRHLQHIACKIGNRVGPCVNDIAGRATAQILHLGCRPQSAVLQLLVFLQEPHQRLIVVGDTAFGPLARRIGGVDLLGHVFVVRLIAHGQSLSSHVVRICCRYRGSAPKNQGARPIQPQPEAKLPLGATVAKLIQTLP
jgi:hypothetical protein